MNLEIKKENGLKSIISYLIIFNIISFFVRFLIILIFNSLNLDLEVKENENIANAILQFSVYFILFIALIRINKDDLLNDVKSFFKKKPKLIFLKILAGYGIFYVINAFATILIQNIETYSNIFNSFFNKELITSTATNQTEIEGILKSKGLIFMFLSAGFIGPICEELVFRKAFFSIYKTKEMGILLSSLCFGLIHVITSFGNFSFVSTILMTIPYLVSGVAFGIIYIKNDCDIMVPTIVHMLSNIISMLGILFLL